MENQTQDFSQQDIQQTKGLAILSYLGLLFLVPMLVNKDSAFTKFHVNQGIILFILELILSVAGYTLGFIPIIGGLVRGVVGIFIFVLAIMGIVNAAQGEAKKLPVIGNIVIYK